jgi:hypothetical protein
MTARLYIPGSDVYNLTDKATDLSLAIKGVTLGLVNLATERGVQHVSKARAGNLRRCEDRRNDK